MKKIVIILLLAIFNMYNLYADDNYKINDNSLKVLKDAGITITKEQKENIFIIVQKYSSDARKILSEIRKIDSKLNNEYKKVDVNLETVKELMFEKKQKEADFDYLIISCDLDILELFSDVDIKKIKYYILFKK
ncbi:hypothetical protein [uncultured Brachyspira sp.]|uniref:hypothetical protein n=1 Tax=uncultured Brachyspira sp. TaxID=221953 RepID=UPI00261DC353|nr:hypothetical protein [uncultured Brachyspira sp.]